jgi:[acyl-carrier-protein] S-malonyltransferase
MARDVITQAPQSAELFARARDVLGYDLHEVCQHGPEDRLNSTAVSQPALFVAGLAAVELLRIDAPDAVDQCAGAAGLSLGEYTALVFAGALSFEDGLRVVKARGEAMQAAADAEPSGMMSVLGLELEKLEEICRLASELGSIRIANYLCPGNMVLSGAKPALAEAERLASEFGAMKTIRLAVAGAFHSPFMKPAVARLEAALKNVPITKPRVPVYSNVDGRTHDDPEEIRGLLVRQVLESVRWDDSMRGMLADGFDRFYELGPGRVLAGLMKRISRRTEIINVTV